MKKILSMLIIAASVGSANELDFSFTAAKSLAEGKDMYKSLANYSDYKYTKAGKTTHKAMNTQEYMYLNYNARRSKSEQVEEDFKMVNKYHDGVSGVISKNGVVFIKSKKGTYPFIQFGTLQAYERYTLENVKEYINYMNDYKKGCVKAESNLMKNGSLIHAYLNTMPHDYVINGEKIKVTLLDGNDWLTLTFYKTKQACKLDK